MSVTSFHRHFKALTRVTPIQYQKQLRLVEARRILDAGADNVTGAAFAVGYESAAQFSRNYARFYGLPPKRDTLLRRLGLSAVSAP
jgi:transcriptional regulator GlxA family with amidase domain